MYGPARRGAHGHQNLSHGFEPRRHVGGINLAGKHPIGRPQIEWRLAHAQQHRTYSRGRYTVGR